MNSRVLKTGTNQITQNFSNTHKAVDLVKYKAQTDYIIAHSDGTIVEVVKNYNKTDKTGNSYGNYVKIKHANGYYTLYAHLKYGSVTVSVGQKVKKGAVIGYMGATGRATGAHLHFEVRDKKNSKINPTPYLNSDLPNNKKLTIYYRVYNNAHWYATTSNGKTAGNIYDTKAISGIQIKDSEGYYIIYEAYDNKLKKWLGEVCKWDETDAGYAGIKGDDIGAFRVKGERPLRYRGYDLDLKKWHEWVSGYSRDDYNGYAGIKGHRLGAIEIEYL